jgi:hypothetical protein
MKTKYAVGDWIYCEFKLQQIKKMREEEITEVTDGHFTLGSHSLNDVCFPLDIKVKCVSDNFEYWNRRLHGETHLNLNFPDIHRWLVGKWVLICESREDDTALNSGMNELEKWATEIINRCRELKQEMIGGIRLFRQ